MNTKQHSPLTLADKVKRARRLAAQAEENGVRHFDLEVELEAIRTTSVRPNPYRHSPAKDTGTAPVYSGGF